MSAIFMNSESSNTSDVQLKLNLTDKMDLRRGDKMDLRREDKRVALSDLVSTKHGKIKKSYKNNIHKMSGTTWDDEFELPREFYSVPDIQDYFEYIIKEHETLVDKPPV